MQKNANVNYHIKADYPQYFVVDADGIKGNIVAPELVKHRVNVEDVRGLEHSINFERDGLLFLTAPSSATDFDVKSSSFVEYERELQQLVKSELGAEQVVVFDHTIRADQNQSVRKPVKHVHSDFSEAGAKKRLLTILGTDIGETWAEGHYAFVNIWRPIAHPVRNSSLGFILPSSVERDEWENIELKYPDRKGEVMGLTYSNNHKWFYMSRMTPNEVVLFNVYDNKGRATVAHSALELDDDDPSFTRQSIESRLLIKF